MCQRNGRKKYSAPMSNNVISNAILIEHLVAGYWLLLIRRLFRAMHVILE
jgi:hypothetical protein